MLTRYLEKVKSYAEANQADLFTAALIFLVGMGSFGLGRLSAVWPEKQRISVQNAGIVQAVKSEKPGRIERPNDSNVSSFSNTKGKFVASKAGKYYHFPWCPGALRIKESNKVWFRTKEAAEGRGYKPASNCPGL